ncbi:Helix-turn-helix domain-containing protein [Paenibacillus sophorae]|uniref:Helix-turn-helix domain-containing protein n=1 Tax=Paenibacillus sophorae TaxID=1333845 RepID=A0A1H8JKG8_9BACL|nr:helix-turn-helix transcriptional regulator [Paenibacillus sophorae]QWU13381.1 helix-turn-helix domain-containing protein [Paenibacillus sophorae]SEN80796.1 Helix-turn-helix domain-containing protein [Paenibacillus sophorae]
MARYKLTPRLTKILKERGIKQIEIANKADIPQPYISRFDGSDKGLYDISNLYSIAKGLNLKIEDLFTIEEIKKKQDGDN